MGMANLAGGQLKADFTLERGDLFDLATTKTLLDGNQNCLGLALGTADLLQEGNQLAVQCNSCAHMQVILCDF